MIDSIYKRGKTWWWQYRPQASRSKVLARSLKTRDRCVAEQRRREWLVEKKQEETGILPPKPLREAAQRPLGEHLADFVADLEALGRSDKHVANIQHRVRELIQQCQWDLSGTVTADAFQEWRRRQRLSAKTLNDYLDAARCFLNWMVRHGRLLHNPLRQVEKVKQLGRETRLRRAFTPEEIARLLGVAPADRRAIYVTAIYTGLRHGELGSLVWDDIDLAVEKPIMRVRASTTKNGKAAPLYLHPDVVVALQAVKPADAAGEAAVFPRMPRIERFRRDLKLAGVAYVDHRGRFGDFHSLRYTFCINLQKAGVPSRVAMSLMRHSDRRLTDKIYTDDGLLGADSVVERLPSVLAGLSQKLSQNSVADRPGVASPDTESAHGHLAKSTVNTSESRDLARCGTGGQKEELAGATGLEPATSAVTGQR